MRRLLATLVLFAGLASPAAAQVIDYGSITVQDAGSCATPKACLTFDVPTLTNALTFQVSGTFSGTLTFEATADTGATPVWFSVIATKLSDGSASTTTTGTGQFYVPNTGLLRVRVRGGSFASGTATVYLTRGYSNARLLYPTFVTVTATSGFLAPTGCTTVPYSFTGDTTTGICRSASGRVAVSSAGTVRMLGVDDSTVGWQLGSGMPLSWSTAAVPSGTADNCIARTATKTLTYNDCAGGDATLALSKMIVNNASGGQLWLGGQALGNVQLQNTNNQTLNLLTGTGTDNATFKSFNFAATSTKPYTSVNGVNTAGYGVPVIYAAGRATAQTGANASVSTFTVGAADGTFEVSANVLVTTATSHAFTVTCAYTDEGNTARTLTLTFGLVAGGVAVTSIANGNGAVPYMGVPLHIRAKAATTITIATTGTFTTVTYNVEGIIRQLA